MNTDEKRLALGTAIRERRVEQGLSQQRLALMVGSSKSHIWRIETGRVGVGIDDLGRIADALDATVSELIPF
ncbi:helix-turn-helix domain-containing protein [Adlercreutzia mucosicola]|uniref:Helix-turn-helix domain-containing protein n=1 Tax=Adlercreutzia mucosicola TaxID=580026 RepID=A0A6N8JRI0_9ACTN|nr:helix-turn-helix transcriptional regulator [Adlercreutzia mucosicola]MCR2034524.1 helix-turn-helix domain-containing protein [Adlercreutzia mucosicola]MEB1814837.1 helix-turn-helix domain-containing protein [Adlercreutzia mucosicola]MVX61356.1 helix-turn-helix domain-containing protein [Adlercreutzia mucosicola]